MNLFTNPGFTTPGGLSSGLDEWDGLDSTSTNVNGPEFTSNGIPTGAWLVGGVSATEGPWGPEEYANKVIPTAGESYTVVTSTSSNAPAIKVTLGLGYPQKQGTPPVSLVQENVMVADGQPITRVALTATIPADYAFDGTNGLTVTMGADNASYIRITEPWIGLTADVPVVPDPEPEPDPEPVLELDPLAKRVAASLDRKGVAATEELASEHLAIVRAFVYGYTRGRGFTDKDIMLPIKLVEMVIVSACMRLTPNPDQLDSYTAGDYSERGATLKGFTLPELAVLNNYRRRTG